MRRGVLVWAAVAAAAVAASSVAAAAHKPAAKMLVFPAAGPINVPSVIVRAEPRDNARRVTIVHEFRDDYRQQWVLAIAGRRDAKGVLWVKLQLQLRPNGTTGWIRASQADLATTHYAIVVHRGRRTIDLYRDGRLLAERRVAVGSPGRETPLGHFYVTARFVPDDPFLGVFAVETSAYSKMTEWPGGGLVGIHGTSMPQLIGQAVSHGCVRVENSTAALLRKDAPLGTPITIVAD